MDIQTREATPAEMTFARSVYFETMRDRIEGIFGRDVGWMQVRSSDDELFLGSLYVIPEMQRLGIGTHVLRDLIGQATQESKAMTLAVMKNNPAVRLYERMDFDLTHEDTYKLYMRLCQAR